MAISAVGSSSTAIQQTRVSEQTQQTQKLAADKAAEEARKAQQAQVQQQAQQQAQRPVVNTQGQTTGNIVNTTA
jgi:hypothetical protein